MGGKTEYMYEEYYTHFVWTVDAVVDFWVVSCVGRGCRIVEKEWLWSTREPWVSMRCARTGQARAGQVQALLACDCGGANKLKLSPAKELVLQCENAPKTKHTAKPSNVRGFFFSKVSSVVVEVKSHFGRSRGKEDVIVGLRRRRGFFSLSFFDPRSLVTYCHVLCVDVPSLLSPTYPLRRVRST